MNYKRFIAAAACLCMTAPMTANCLPSIGTAAEGTAVIGDVNNDGALAVADLVMFQRWLGGAGELTAWGNADYSQDGSVDIFDFCLMRKALNPANNPPAESQTVNLCQGVIPESVTGSAADEEFILGQTKFYLSLMQETVKSEEAGTNILISPYSVMQALAMTANGADGETKTEMESVLGGMSMDRLNEYLYTQRKSYDNEQNSLLSTANSIWIRDDDDRITVLPEFLQTNKSYYDADAFMAPFDETTVTDINDWVSKETYEMIPEIIDKIDDDIVMYLINAIGFDAEWAEQYTKADVYECDFTAYDGTVQQAEMMGSDDCLYLEDDNAVGVYKYYKGRKYAFAAIMPNEGISLDDYIAGLTPESLNEILTNPKGASLISGIPKFKYEYNTTMNDSLEAMGMPRAFTPSADFTRMAKTKSGYLYIDFVLHKTFIELSEYGTMAGAVTAVGMTEECMKVIDKEVILDRPFLYCIVDTETDLPIFMGTLSQIPGSVE
ncbi:MAG: serine protease [Ruminococcus sp.]|nr:serine protease [Ruminococcus sp.]